MAMEFAETELRRKEYPELLVTLLMVLLRLECEKSMELTTSSNRSCLFLSSCECRDEAALPEFVSTGARRKERYRVSHSFSQHGTYSSSCDGHVGYIV